MACWFRIALNCRCQKSIDSALALCLHRGSQLGLRQWITVLNLIAFAHSSQFDGLHFVVLGGERTTGWLALVHDMLPGDLVEVCSRQVLGLLQDEAFGSSLI